MWTYAQRLYWWLLLTTTLLYNLSRDPCDTMRKVKSISSIRHVPFDPYDSHATILDLLERYADEPPSLVLHLYPTYFRFEHEVSRVFAIFVDLVIVWTHMALMLLFLGWFLFIQESVQGRYAIKMTRTGIDILMWDDRTFWHASKKRDYHRILWTCLMKHYVAFTKVKHTILFLVLGIRTDGLWDD